ncbi:RNA polymerase factor sigma-54 [Lacticaseibacillus baoqingensis]|uniref:RNA polymerase factor sigma-54 n=1 Tax=Lacticaseibacillus baoqingensis TaxID=2486013 RepID=A0ABW4ECD8_9LACO|nr:RNA polymerase factor sigma-54 [Lacticaseibacillus baoqingensis]
MGYQSLGTQQRQTQKQALILSQKMQQSLTVLQMNTFELTHYLQNISAENPLLDVSTRCVCPESSAAGLNQIVDDHLLSLPDYLLEQVRISSFDNSTKKDVVRLIDQIDNRGYLTESDSDLCKILNFSLSRLVHAKFKLQELEPAGVGACSLQECLLLQLDARKEEWQSPVRILVANHFEALCRQDWNKICRQMKINRVKLSECLRELHHLTANPGQIFDNQKDEYVLPELRVCVTGDKISLELVRGAEPQVVFVHETYETLRKHNDFEVQEYLKIKRNQFMDIAQACRRREKTLVAVGSAIVESQFEYFRNPNNGLKSVTLQQISQRVGLSESTVSRAIRGKYIQTDYTVLPIRNLLMTGQATIGSEIMSVLQEIVKNESIVLSDDQIRTVLSDRGFNISRRTVAKYRQLLEIPPASRRRKLSTVQ